MAVIVMNGNVIKNKIIQVGEVLAGETLLKLNMLLNTTLNGMSIEQINLGLIARLKEQAGIHSRVISDVLDAVYKGKNVYAASTLAGIAYGGIVDAVAKFEDEEDGIEKVMFINPAQEAALLKDSDFLSADKFQAGVAVNGSIGKIAGCWIKKSKKVRLVTHTVDDSAGDIQITDSNIKEYQAKVDPSVTLTTSNKVKALAAASQYYLCPIIKLEPDSPETEYTEDELPAVTIFLKKDIQVDSEWFPKKQQTDVTAAKYYGVALTNDAKVVLAKFKK